MTPVTQEILPKTDEKLARTLLQEVDGLLDQARNGRESLHKTYVEIGLALEKVDQTKAWQLVARTFDSYIKDHCEPRFGKSRTQLYGYRSVAKNLLPQISKEKLIEMGVSRAMPLAAYVTKKGTKVPEELLQKALDKTMDAYQLRAAIAEAQYGRPEVGKWFDLGGFFCTDEEKEEIVRVFKIAEQEDPLPLNTSDWLVRKIVIQRLIMEFQSSYAPSQQSNL